MPVVVGAIGVVYGDIGTSPLYTLRQCFTGIHPLPLTHDNVLGILSIIFWALVVVVTLKYVTLIMRADNRGEGGILALTALVSRGIPDNARRRWWLIGFGIFGAAMFYGDGMITPAISVLGAVEGLEIIAPRLHQYIVPVTLVVIVLLFAIQKRGTASVGLAVRARDVHVVRRAGGAGAAADRAQSGGARRRQSRLRDRVRAREPDARLPRARRGRAGGDRHRGALRRHGPLRRVADPPRLAVLRRAVAGAQLLRPGRAAARRPDGDQEPVLPARAAVGADPAGDPRDLRGDHRVAGGHLGRLLAHARRDPDGLLPPPEDPAHVVARDRPDLRAVHQLVAADRGDAARRRLPQLGQPGRRLRDRGHARDADRLRADLLRDAAAVALVAAARARDRRAAHPDRHRVPRLQRAQDPRRRLVPAADRRRGVHAAHDLEARPDRAARPPVRGHDAARRVHREHLGEPGRAGARAPRCS